jgi:prophage endopeptidase
MIAVWEMIKTYWKLALLLVAFGLGWYVEGLRWSKDVEAINLAHTQEMKAISDASAKQAADALTKQQALEQQYAALDAKYQGDLKNAKAENDNLQRAVKSGALKLRVKAKCPVNGGVVSKTAAGSSVGDGITVELDPTAGSNILDIRAGILSDQAKLKYFQDKERIDQLIFNSK